MTQVSIGPYTILGELGRGGMGTVYRARDNRLRRDVALKVLPDELRLSPTRLARFEQEARLVAALNHPNIATIYGIQDGEAGVQALVLELVEGKTLAARIAEGRVGIAEALTMARQIAQALEAAHEKGIVHRDLKPANIVIAPTGLVKVLDFGIAKMTDPSEIATSETVTAPFTREGVVVGTPAYMSPEQSRGQAVDKRADLWAFGCVLYEMLTGQRPFEGETSSQTLTAVQTTDPDWGRLPPQVPAVITTVMKRCLEREPPKRLADVAAIRFALEDTPFLAGQARVAEDPRRTVLSARTVVLYGAAAIAILAAGVGIGRWRSAGPAVAAPAETPVTFRHLTDVVGMEETPALSPDGRTLAYVAADGDGYRQIWERPKAGGDTVQITRDPTDHLYPRWAPGGGLLYYVPPPKEGATGTLMEVPDLGGTSKPITAAMGASDISHDGKRVAVFQPGPTHTVMRIVNRDGTVQREIDVGEFETYEWLRWSPDDRSIAFTTSTSVAFQRTLHVVPAAGGKVSDVVNANRIQGLAWLPDSRGLVYASSAGSTLAYPPLFNLHRISIDGSGDKALTFGDVSYVEPDVVGNQVVVSSVRMQSNVWRYPVLDSPGKVMAGGIQITHQTGQVQAPSVSPDNTQIVYVSDNGGHSNLWIKHTDGPETRQLTFESDPATVIGVPNWSPAGDRIVYVRSRDRVNAQWVIPADGRGQPRELVPSGVAATWNRDGSWLYFFDSDCIQKIPADGGTAVKVRCGHIGGPAISNDESTLYWGRDDNRSGEIMRASPVDGPAQVFSRFSTSRIPWWPITHTISPDNRSLATPLKDGATTNIWRLSTADGQWRPLTDFGHRAILITRIVSWTRDGKFVFAAITETDADIGLFDGLIR